MEGARRVADQEIDIRARTPELDFLLPKLQQFENFSRLREMTEEGPLACVALASLRPVLAAALFKSINKTILYVAANPSQAEKIAEILTSYLPEDDVAFFSDWETFPHEPMPPNIEAVGRRLCALNRLRRRPLLVVAAVQTLLQKLPDPRLRVDEPLHFKVNHEIDLNNVTERLVEMGYRRVSLVENRGEFARRGSIVDIYSSTGDNPIRIDLFGNVIETIRLFSVDDQRSMAILEETSVYPCREFRSNDVFLDQVRSKLAQFNFYAGSESNVEDLARRFLPALLPMASPIDYLPEETLWLVDEMTLIFTEADRFLKQQPRLLEESFAGLPPLTTEDYYLTLVQLQQRLKAALSFEEFISNRRQVAIEANPPAEAMGRIELLESQLAGYRKEGFSVVLTVKDIGELERLGQLLEQSGWSWTSEPSLSPQRPVVRIGRVEQGFILPELKLVLLGQSDIFPRHLSPQRLSYVSKKKALIDFAGLKIGDFLVHESHGIARYQGLTRQTIDNTVREYLILEYAAGDRLYLPTDQLHKVSRYIGPDTNPPRITRLGSTEWLRATNRARTSVKKLAIDLLALYAERARSLGHKFSEDTVWQQELESAFPYPETKDQLSAIIDVKRDMETPIPMDRLVCGDVGYGKTEVAVRAAFKTILDGKQVMMLVPTTILAQQHYLTFKERFAPYPVEVEMLSRFRSPATQRRVVEEIKRGRVDLVVGTHRLLQKDLEFHDLGLVIVDEEQRFGVSHKEHLRAMKKSVDVLTLSATPIPRTLQMSLSGVRNLSIIDTPPEGRHSVLTYVGEYQVNMITVAVRRELNRGGQVFYLHNRVEDIDKAARKLARLIPEARIAVAHGRMSERELEKVMLDYLDQKADVLVCTTIIESGLDIPNANTLIVEEADNLGLAQLYQLRGRVGRAHHQAYAYFTYPPDRLLTTTALERLKTIAQFTELGSGFRIALRDLEIRGAGNLLGPEQHGHMSAVGFELYCRMLGEAVDELQGGLATKRPETQIDLPLPAFIPSDYIEDENLRLDTYRALAKVQSVAELVEQEQELNDRFGKPPAPVASLLKLTELKVVASKVGVTAVIYRQRRLLLKGVSKTLAGKFSERLSRKYHWRYKSGTAELTLKISIEPAKLVPFLLRCIGPVA